MQTATIAAILPGQHAVFEFPGVIENNQPVINGHTAQTTTDIDLVSSRCVSAHLTNLPCVCLLTHQAIRTWTISSHSVPDNSFSITVKKASNGTVCVLADGWY